MAYFPLLLVSSVLCLLSEGFPITETNPNCPQKWSYCTKSNKCLQVFGFGSDGVFPLTWTKAEEYCRDRFHGHLASFDFEEELTLVVDLTQSAGYDDGGGSPIHIGLAYNGALGWEHPDGSGVKYLRWYRTDLESGSLMGQYPAGILYTRSRYTSYMWVYAATNALPFVCQVAPVNNGGK